MGLAKMIQFNVLGDERGQLISLESNKNVPFAINRIYYIYGVELDVRRGFHAHKKLEQILICTSGSCNVLLDDGIKKQVVRLDNPTIGLFVGGLIWHEMYDFSPECVLMVLASEHYDEADYIHDYERFLKEERQ